MLQFLEIDRSSGADQIFEPQKLELCFIFDGKQKSSGSRHEREKFVIEEMLMAEPTNTRKLVEQSVYK